VIADWRSDPQPVIIDKMSYEIELKFQIPTTRLPSLRRAVTTTTARVENLSAVYVDTQHEHLANAGLSMRLRGTGPTGQQVWVQTLKAEGGSAIKRFEHNVALGGPGHPVLDPRRHDGSEAGAVLEKTLAAAGDAVLIERFFIEVKRTIRLLRKDGSLIEIALDEGEITAGGESLRVCEIEFELVQGSPATLLEVAQRWVERFGLLLDARSKSDRGYRLAIGKTTVRTAKARPLQLPPQSTPQQSFAAMLNNVLSQILPNAGQIQEGQFEPEHLHQLRVGLRRLRTILRLYGSLSPQLPEHIEPEVAELFRKSGAARDLDAMAETLWPALKAAEAPLVEIPPPVANLTQPNVPTLLRAPATQSLWLALLRAAHPQDEPQGPCDSLREVLATPLRKLEKKIRRDDARFAILGDEERHQLRKRIKRLRYAAELVGSLWPQKPVQKFLRRLQRAQTPLGQLNDAVVAFDLYRNLARQDPRAWFAAGWLAARKESLLGPCNKVLADLAARRGFWRR
jgi:inorganic triphosphatase YgiF